AGRRAAARTAHPRRRQADRSPLAPRLVARQPRGAGERGSDALPRPDGERAEAIAAGARGGAAHLAPRRRRHTLPAPGARVSLLSRALSPARDDAQPALAAAGRATAARGPQRLGGRRRAAPGGRRRVARALAQGRVHGAAAELTRAARAARTA